MYEICIEDIKHKTISKICECETRNEAIKEVVSYTLKYYNNDALYISYKPGSSKVFIYSNDNELMYIIKSVFIID